MFAWFSHEKCKMFTWIIVCMFLCALEIRVKIYTKSMQTHKNCFSNEHWIMTFQPIPLLKHSSIWSNFFIYMKFIFKAINQFSDCAKNAKNGWKGLYLKWHISKLWAIGLKWKLKKKNIMYITLPKKTKHVNQTFSFITLYESITIQTPNHGENIHTKKRSFVYGYHNIVFTLITFNNDTKKTQLWNFDTCNIINWQSMVVFNIF